MGLFGKIAAMTAMAAAGAPVRAVAKAVKGGGKAGTPPSDGGGGGGGGGGLPAVAGQSHTNAGRWSGAGTAGGGMKTKSPAGGGGGGGATWTRSGIPSTKWQGQSARISDLGHGTHSYDFRSSGTGDGHMLVMQNACIVNFNTKGECAAYCAANGINAQTGKLGSMSFES